MQIKNFAMAVVALVLSSSFASAQEPSGAGDKSRGSGQNPSVTTTQFDDWALTCRKPGNAGPSNQSCELVQTIMVKGQKYPFAQLLVGKVDGETLPQIMAVLPANIALPSSVSVSVDEKDTTPLELKWSRCVQTACFAAATMKDEIRKKWSALDTRGRIVFKASNRQDITIPFSFKGLKSALEALAREK